MGNPAARMGDMVLQDAPHCHAPIHPPAPVPTPAPHPALPLAIISGQPTVLIGGTPAARSTDQTAPCVLPTCVPGGPGLVAIGSATCSPSSDCFRDVGRVVVALHQTEEARL